MNTPLRIGIVAGESSGDILGASLIRSLKKKIPDLIVEGIGGPRMIAEGCRSMFAMDRLSVMGLVEPLKRLPELLRMRRKIKQHFAQNPPEVFMGIDSPDFTLNIEKYLHGLGIKTMHYVSPSVWAWRQNRIHSIKQYVDHMLTLFPFEQAIYQQHGIPVTFVGHPLADEFPLECNTALYRKILGLKPDGVYIALLPGSRENEVSLLAPVMLIAAQLCATVKPELHFLIPAANAARKQHLVQLLEPLMAEHPALKIILYDGQSHEVMGASDVVVLASGTATLEAMLLKKPMIVTYKFGALTYQILLRMVKVQSIALPNLLAGRKLVPELIQQGVTAEQISRKLLDLLGDKYKLESLKAEFTNIHEQLKCNAGDHAARAVLDVIGQRSHT
jgi:lipid-A-disaccharide synthase